MPFRIVALCLFVTLLAAAPARLLAEETKPGSPKPRKVETSRANPLELPLPDTNLPSFSFIIFGDRTTGPGSGLEILRKAVEEANVIQPDFVITVGDLVPGYCNHEKWIYQMKTHRVIMDQLEVPWFPVPGNHDLYWRDKKAPRPKTEHEKNWETHYAPLWYSFTHKKCCFVSVCTDEGDPATGEKDFGKTSAQAMSPAQTAWLKDTLKEAKGANHVFLFQHHPRWAFPQSAADWKRTHSVLKKAGNVSAVFAGHTHVAYYCGKTDGIEYFILSCTGGKLQAQSPMQGLLHHYDLVTVRGKSFHVARIPVGSVIDPKAGPGVLRSQPRRKVVILKKTKWKIESEKTRILPYPIAVPDFPCQEGLLRIIFEGAGDDTGDKGVCYSLLDHRGRSVRNGFIKFSKSTVVDHGVKPNTKWTLLLIDMDTKLDGKLPGNAGYVRVQVNHGKPERARRPRKANPPRKTAEVFRDYLEDRVFKFTAAGKVLNTKLVLHHNGIVGHKRLSETSWEVNERKQLVFRDDTRAVSTVFKKLKIAKDGKLTFEGKSKADKGTVHVLEEVE